MNTDPPILVQAPRVHPALLILTAFPVACFICALGTDIIYASTADMMWSDFSDWLLFAGMVGGVLAALGGCLDALVHRHARTARRVVPLAIGGIVILVLGFVDNLVHSRDAWTSVVPLGLLLSAATVLAILFTAWLASARVRTRVVTAQYSGVRS